MNTTERVTYDPTAPALVVHELTVTNPAVTTEALRWADGRRGPAVSADELAGSDLTAFAQQAIIVGAQAIACAGGSQDTYNLEQLIQDVGSRTAEASTIAAQSTQEVVSQTTKALRETSTQVGRTLTDAGDEASKQFRQAVGDAKTQLQEQVRLLFGGDDPQVLSRLEPLLTKFGSELAKHTQAQTAELISRATRTLDPADPTSPLARHHEALNLQQKALVEHLERQHRELSASVEEVKTALAVQKAASEASKALASITPLKGGTYEMKVHHLLAEIAVGLGDEYVETGSTVGALARCKKGDGVLTVMGGLARVAVEMSASDGREWSSYLDLAERNRSASASIGLVPTSDHNAGQSVRVLGPRRIVVAFDPDSDDGAVLRMAVQLLRVAALAAASERSDSAVHVARERITEALKELARVEKVRKAASAIHRNANTVETEAERLTTQLNRLLVQAQTALLEPAAEEAGPAATPSVA